MGFEKERARQALIRSDNNIEAALSLLIEGDQVSTGLASNKEEDALAKLSGEEREALTEKIETLTSMGFSDDVAISALLQCDGDVDSALDHLLEN
eukprot:gene26282-32216_t